MSDCAMDPKAVRAGCGPLVDAYENAKARYALACVTLSTSSAVFVKHLRLSVGCSAEAFEAAEKARQDAEAAKAAVDAQAAEAFKMTSKGKSRNTYCAKCGGKSNLEQFVVPFSDQILI